jgi:selenocysteine lyase/cysteine desulfurase
MPNLLENHFAKFRRNIVGNNFEHPFASGKKKIVYADWAASGRLYRPIEACLADTLGPYVANTHTETTLTGTVMTHAYQQARAIIKKHVNATGDDQLLFAGFGMTAAINKLQRLLGLHVHEKYKTALLPAGQARPLVIITHMEHHSNQTSWEECLCEVAIIRRNFDGRPSLEHLREILRANQNRPLLIGSFTACSNVTGILTPYHQMAEIMHEFGGYCFVDFSASAPYVAIDMHPAKDSQRLDAIYFSPHKFLGGPGSSGVVVFNRALYQNLIPDQPGGGTVVWTNPWGEHHFYDDIEVREDGGTPGFLQAIKGALAILLKEEMGISKMGEREHQLKERLLERLLKIPALQVLEPQQRQRLGFVSFYVRGLHHNLIVRLLNDKFGIQTRGGCSCAGTYGHILLHINHAQSKKITDEIDHGDLSSKPGWVRISLHPTMTDAEVEYIAEAVDEIVKHHHRWKDEYTFDPHTGDFRLLKASEFRLDLKQIFHE